MTFAPICVACASEMLCRKNDYFFADYGAVAIWSGDMFQCESCGNRIVVGVGREPVAVSHKPDFAPAARHSEFTLERKEDDERRIPGYPR